MDSEVVGELQVQASQIVERLEQAVEKATEAITALEDGKEETEINPEDLGLKGESWKNIQGFLQAKARNKEDTLKILEDLIVYEAGDEEGDSAVVTAIAPLTQLAKLSLIIHTIIAYCHSLDPAHLNKINRRIQIDVTRWITHLFRFHNYNAFYHDEPLEGLVRLTRLLLHLKYPKYLEDGYLSLTQQQPVIYGEISSSLGLLQHLCRQLGLPLSCLHALPATAAGTMDIVALKLLMQKDSFANRIPLMVLADAGSPITGHMDDLPQLREVCKEFGVWLHVRGHSIATYAVINAPSVVTPIADSYSLTPGSWLGIPCLPMVTLYKQLESNSGRTVGATREATLPLIAGLVPDNLQKRLVSLSLWFSLQGLGREGLQERIRSCILSTQRLWYRISKLPQIRLLSKTPLCREEVLPISELLALPNSSSTAQSLFDVSNTMLTTVVFQFVPETENGEPFVGKVPSYFDMLNSWMEQILQRDVPNVNVEMCDLDGYGLVLRLCPLEGVLTISTEDVDAFVNCLIQQLEILSATVRLKPIFRAQVESHPQLQLVEMPGWAGLGGVRYLPLIEEGQEPITVDELNKLNMELVAKLRSTDSAFSQGEGEGGQICVRFGMVTADTDIDDLLGLVTAVGAQVEESAKYLDTMVEIVKKGIETATLDLQKETEERIWQDGILRHVPVFGSIVNWWAPKTTETGIKGRSLNLQAGVVESTENIYRYHMQLQQGEVAGPGSKPTPTPQVQTSIVPDGDKAHSRSSSHASHSSHTSNPPAAPANES